MTHVRRPNRRRLAGLDEALNGGACPTTGKVRYLNERNAEIARGHLAGRDPDPNSLNVYHHDGPDGCHDWHVGHLPTRST